jgi:hypothetical protein
MLIRLNKFVVFNRVISFLIRAYLILVIDIQISNVTHTNFSQRNQTLRPSPVGRVNGRVKYCFAL